MGTHVIGGKSDVIAASVIVNGEIDQSLIAAGCNTFSNERRLQHAIAALAGNVVDAVDREVKLAR